MRKKILFFIWLMMLFFLNANSQQNFFITQGTISLGSKPDTTGSYYGAKMTNGTNSIIGCLGQPAVGTMSNSSYSIASGLWSFYLLEPMAPTVNASDGDFADYIKIGWHLDPLSPPADENYKLYREGSLLATLSGDADTYQDFNIYAGLLYEYSVEGINEFSVGEQGDDIGFLNPNGVITGNVETQNNVAVPDVEVALTPNLGKSLNFDGTDDYADMGHQINLANSSFTIEFWAKRMTSSTDDIVIGVGTVQSDNTYLRLGFNSADKFMVDFGNNSLATSLSYTETDWHHWAITFDNATTERTIYRDGLAVAIDNAGNNFLGMGKLYIGKSISPGQEYSGYLDDLRIWNDVRTREEIRNNKGRTVSKTEDENLLAYWKFDEGLSNKLFDLTDNDYDGFSNGAQWSDNHAPVLVSAFTNGSGNYIIGGINYSTGTTFTVIPSKTVPIGRALDYDGNDDYVQVAALDTVQNKITYEAWIKPTSDDNNTCPLHGKFDGTDALKWEISSNGTQLTAYMRFDSWQNIGGGSLSPNVWNHIAVTCNDNTNTANIYINGNASGSFTYTGAFVGIDEIWFGATASPSHYFYGAIDEVRIWNTERTQNQILGTKNQVLDGNEFGLAAYWKFNEGRGNVVVDNSENGESDGVIINPDSSDIWSDNIPLEENVVHEFSPEERYVTLNPSNTSADGIDFDDVSLVPVSGYVKYANTNCYADSIEIYIDGNPGLPQIYTDDDGYFVVELEPGTSHKISPHYGDHIFNPAFFEVMQINEPISGVLFEDQRTRDVEVTVAGGDCGFPIIPDQGEIEITLMSSPSCYQVSEPLTSGTSYTFQGVPPLKYVVSVYHPSPNVNFDAYQISTKDSSQAIDFIYYAPLETYISGLPTNSCGWQVLDQYRTYQMNIDVYESYSEFGMGQCPIDSGTVTITGGFVDGQDSTLIFTDGGIEDLVFKPGKPNILGGGEHPYQKSIQVIAQDEKGRTATTTEWVYIEGQRPRENTFVTVTPELPLYILRDPPGDGSYSYLTQEMSVTTSISVDNLNYSGSGIEDEIKLGPDFSISGGIGVETEIETDTEITPTLMFNSTSSTSNGTQLTMTTTSTETFSTSDADVVIGKKSDVFVGGAMNMTYGLTDVLSVIQEDGSCYVDIDTTMMMSPDGFATFYVYSELHIRNSLLPNLQMLSNLYDQKYEDTGDSTYADSAFYYAQQDTVWQQVLAMNDSLKHNATFSNNVSFDANAGGYESIEITERSNTTSITYNQKVEDEVGLKIGATVGGMGRFLTFKWNSGSEFDSTYATTGDTTTTVGYMLDDDDPGDYFTVDVMQDAVYGTPVFKLVSGASSCPWEGEELLEYGGQEFEWSPGTMPREGVYLDIDPYEAINIPPSEAGVYTLTLGNTSQTGEVQVYGLRLLPESNPDAASIRINGAFMGGGSYVPFQINAGEQIQATMTVERGPDAYDYNDIKLMFHSLCEYEIWKNSGDFSYENLQIKEIKPFSAHFLQPCTEVSIYEPSDNWLITPDDNDTLLVTITDYDLTENHFLGLKLQYRLKALGGNRGMEDGEVIIPSKSQFAESQHQSKKSHSSKMNLSQSKSIASGSSNFVGGERFNPWINVIIYQEHGDGMIPKDSIPGNYIIVPWDLTDVDDGVYEIRVKSVCSGDSYDGASGILTGIIDRTGPQLFGQPQPVDGILGADDQISITFDETIDCTAIDPLEHVKLKKISTDALIDTDIDCSGDQIIITPTVPDQYLENYTLRAVVKNIKDIYGTAMEDSVEWEFYVDRSPVRWSNAFVNEVKYEDETLTITRQLLNSGGELKSFTLTNIPSWITPSIYQGEIPPGGAINIDFYISDQIGGGMYDDILYADITASGDEPLRISLRVLCYSPAWSVDASDYEHSMTIDAVLFVEDEPSEDTYDVIGAFVDEELRGIGQVTYFPGLEDISGLHPYQVFMNVYSNQTDGETVNFEVWDASECRHLVGILDSYIFEANAIHGTPMDPDSIRATTQITQNTNFSDGWNWFSNNLISTDMSINSVLSNLSPIANDLIKDQTSYSQYTQGVGWVGSLDTLYNQSMYMMKLANADTLKIMGYPVNPALMPVVVDSGWNWIGYLPQFSMEVGAALEELLFFSGDLLKTQTEFAQYLENVGWIGSLYYMNPKKGYLLFTDNPDMQILTYPDEVPLGRAFYPPQITETELPDGWEVTPGDYQYNMTVTGIVLRNGEVITDSLEAIGAFCDDECRGVAYPAYVPQMEQSFMFLMMYSNAATGEIMEFKAYEETGDTTYLINEVVEFGAEEILGSVEEPFIWSYDVEMTGLTDNFIAIPERYELGQNYPNPFNPKTTISYALPEDAYVDIGIYNVAGQKVRTLVSEEQDAGYKKVIWDSRDDSGKAVTSGVYIYRMKAGVFKETKRLVLLK